MNPVNEWQMCDKIRNGFDFYRRHEQKVGDGTPDIEFGYDGKFGWLETKFVRGFNTGSFIKLGVRPAQCAEIGRRIDAGQYVAVAAYFEHSIVVGDYMLFHGDSVVVTEPEKGRTLSEYAGLAFCVTDKIQVLHEYLQRSLKDHYAIKDHNC